MWTYWLKRTVLTVTLATTGLATPASAEQPASSETDYQVIKIITKCGTRSLHGTYRDANEACKAAARLRTKSSAFAVEVVTGVSNKPLSAPYTCVYEVYCNPCKGYLLHCSCYSLHDAFQVASELAKTNDNIEIVTRYGR
jgi:hypothetical protein